MSLWNFIFMWNSPAYLLHCPCSEPEHMNFYLQMMYNTYHVILSIPWGMIGSVSLSLLTRPPQVSHTTYCNVVIIACYKASQLMLRDTGIGNVQKSPMWGLGSIGGNADEVEISTVFITQCPVHSDIHSSTDIFWEVNTRESGDRRRTWRDEWLSFNQLKMNAWFSGHTKLAQHLKTAV